MLHRTTRHLLTAALALGPLALLACGDNKTPAPRQGYEASTLPQLSCAPNLDGTIEAKELRPALGVAVRNLVSPQGKARTVDLVGSGAAPTQAWDLGTDYADDQVATISASAVGDKWYAATFPSATFTAPLDAGGLVDAIYANNDTAIVLLGLASRDADGPGGKTLLVYDAPITIYRFPMTVGAAWSSSASVKNGTLRGQPYAGKDTYDVVVDGRGKLVLPDYTFTDVLRVRTTVKVEASAGPPVTVQRQTSFVFECFGEVARATSQPNEAQTDFTNAAELRRLGL